MLELRRPRPILRDARPIIRPRLILVRPQTNHRLNGKRHARLRNPHRLILRIMRHIRRAMEQRIHPMSAIRLDNTTPLRFRVFFDNSAGVFERHAGLHERDGLVETFAGGLDDPDGVGVGEGAGADVVGFVEVAVVAAVVEGDVEVYDVAVEEGALVGDPMADYFVYGGADGFGEVDVVEGGGVGLGAISEKVREGEGRECGAYVSFYAGFVHYFVDVVCSDARFECSCSYVEHLSRYLADFSHALLPLFI